MKLKFFDLARKISLKSDHPVHKMGGIIVKKSKVISLGYNKYKTHVKSNHPYKHIHCELDCILGVNREDLIGADIYIYRENKLGNKALAKPCYFCEALLREVGIKNAFYTGHNGYVKESYA